MISVLILGFCDDHLSQHPDNRKTGYSNVLPLTLPPGLSDGIGTLFILKPGQEVCLDVGVLDVWVLLRSIQTPTPYILWDKKVGQALKKHAIKTPSACWHCRPERFYASHTVLIRQCGSKTIVCRAGIPWRHFLNYQLSVLKYVIFAGR